MRLMVLFTLVILGRGWIFTYRDATKERNEGTALRGQDSEGERTCENRGWIETLSWEPRAHLWHSFITEKEADHLIELAQPHMKKSQVVDSVTGVQKSSLHRTSSGYYLKRGQDEVVSRIEQRIADWTMLPVENGEPLHVLHYQQGEQYKEHWDYFHDDANVKNGGQRLATVLIYLTEVDEGGETVFPDSAVKPAADALQNFSKCGQAGIAARPKKGDALLFWDFKPDGVTKDASSKHAGCPVCPNGNPDGTLKCDKWSVTKWIRSNEYVPAQ